MVRKIVTIQPDMFEALEVNKIMEQYKRAMLEASQDRLYMDDMGEIEDAFSCVDNEKLN